MQGPWTITQLGFHVGARDGGAPLLLPCGPLTVLVGPNGAGKSQTLADIVNWSQDRRVGIVLNHVAVEPPSSDEFVRLLQPYHQPRGPQEPPLDPGTLHIVSPGMPGMHAASEAHWHEQNFKAELEHDRERAADFARATLPYFLAHWTGSNRHELTHTQPLTSLQGPPRNIATALFVDSRRREAFREKTHAALGRFPVLDPTTQPGQLVFRMASEAPPEGIEEHLSPSARNYFSRTARLDDESDGVRSFVALIAGLVASDLRVILIDEPEAFLHPPLARRLGARVAELATDSSRSVVVATHSAAFLQGCIESAETTTIVRLGFDPVAKLASVAALRPDDLRPLVTDPLLRSARSLEGLFHKCVVVTEADADRALYDELNRRLLEVGRGLDEAQFVNAQNGQTVARIVAPLRKIGVPAAGILDLDMLWSADGVWDALYEACDLPRAAPQREELERRRVACRSDSLGQSVAKRHGLSGLTGATRTNATNIVKRLNEFGLFLVPVGELENWLPRLGLSRTRKKADWIVAALTRLGRTPQIVPRAGDVWAFLDRIARWVSNPERFGMPSSDL